MFAIEPTPTNYDINFSFFGIPVRIHPFFFLLPVLWGADYGDIFVVLVFVLVFFISILVHELGHVLAMMSMGQRARILLYSMGGLAIPDGSLGFARRTRITTRDEILISAAGPVAGFLLALLVIGLIMALGGKVQIFHWMFGVVPVFAFDFSGSNLNDNFYLRLLFSIAVNINVYMNLFNLLPVLPLDGGQILRSVLVEANAWNGMKWALWTSVILAAAIAFFGFTRQPPSTFLGIFFAYLAISNYQTLQMGGPGGFGGGRNPW